MVFGGRARQQSDYGIDGMIGETGVAFGEIPPEGKVFAGGKYWNAVSPTPVPAGMSVRVTAIRGLKLTVEPISKPGD
jgi:membrane-bound ClpP family serine protease